MYLIQIHIQLPTQKAIGTYILHIFLQLKGVGPVQKKYICIWQYNTCTYLIFYDYYAFLFRPYSHNLVVAYLEDLGFLVVICRSKGSFFCTSRWKKEIGQDLRYTFLNFSWHTDAKKIPEKLVYRRHLACFFQKTKFF